MRPHKQPARLPHPWDSPGRNTGVGCHFLLQCMKVKSESEVAQSSPTLPDPMDCSPPGSSVHGVFQARTLEWGAIAFSGGTSILFSIVMLPVYIPTNSIGGLPFLYAFSSICYLQIFLMTDVRWYLIVVKHIQFFIEKLLSMLGLTSM